MVTNDPITPEKRLRPDWRDPESYKHLQKLFRAGWAWEWLKRNPEFIAACRQTAGFNIVQRGGAGAPWMLSPADIDRFSRWGVLFRRRRRCVLGSRGPSGGAGRRGRAGGLGYTGHFRSAAFSNPGHGVAAAGRY